MNRTFRKREVLFIIFDGFELGIKGPGLTVAWLFITIFFMIE